MIGRILLGLTGAVAAIALMAPSHAEKAVNIPAAIRDVKPQPGLQTAILAGGCFWGMEAVFEGVRGVKAVTSGYAGGSASTATYDHVATENTRHAEAIKIVYDPRTVSYGTLLRVYFSVAHDPTQVNGQFPDSGPSYRSAIFPQTGAQALVARQYIDQLTRAHSFAKPIATRLETGNFYSAETYHQDFARKNPKHPYIMRYDRPKIEAFRSVFPKLAV